jgi:hypothetical protein
MNLTDYEREHLMTLYAQVNDYLIAMKKVQKLADENNWYVISHELEEKIDLMEHRSRELLKEVMK